MVDKISRARRRELEQPDPFIEAMNKAVERAVQYKKQIIWVSCAVLAVVVIFSGTIYSIKSAGIRASELLDNAVETYTRAEDPVQGYADVKDDFKTILDEYANTASGRLAMVRFAEIAYRASEFKTALDLYQSALGEFKHDPVMRNLLLNSLGRTCQALNAYDRAAGYFQKIVQGDNDFLKDEALFNLGMSLSASGKDKESQACFQKIVSNHKDSLYLPLAESRLGT